MAFSKPPAWIINPIGLQNSFKHNIYLPPDLNQHLSLQDFTSFTQGARQFFYWKGDLAPTLHNNTIMLAFLGPEGLKKINVINVMKALAAIIDISSLIEVYQGANTNFLGLSFGDPEVVNAISHHFLYFEDSVVTHITHSASNIHPFHLLWLPPLFHQDRVHHLLSSLTGHYNLRKENIQTSDFGYTPTNTIRGFLTPKPGQSINNLPHLLSLPSPYKGSALLIITGRPPLCLKCREIGHLRKDCPMQKCSMCNKVHFSSSPCGTSSYSSVASRNISHFQDSDWLAHLADDDPNNIGDLSSSPDSPINISLNPMDPSDISHTPLPEHNILASPSSDSTMDSINYATTITPELLPKQISSECGRTFSNILPDHTLLSSTSHKAPSLPLPSNLSSPSTSNLQDSTSNPALSRIPISKLTNATINISTASTPEDTRLTPPLTRSQSSKKKRITSLPSSTSLGIRSENIIYSRHSSDSKKPHQSFITSHFSSIDSSLSHMDNSNDSDSSSEHEILSDVSIDLTLHQDAMDFSSSRKRKNIPSPPSNDSTLSNIDNTNFILDSAQHSSTPHALHDSKVLSSTLSHDDSPSIKLTPLSDADSNIAYQFHLDDQSLLHLKKSCPGHEFSAITLKKLKLLLAYGIPILQAADHPQFFNLSPTSISNRLKSLSSHHPSTLNITDLFASSAKFERLTGLTTPQYVLPSIPANPFSPSGT